MYEKRRRLVTRVVTQGAMQFQVQEEVVEDVWVPDPAPPPPRAIKPERHLPSASDVAQSQLAAKLEADARAKKAIEEYEAEVIAIFEQTKKELGYLPPHDSPLLVTRALHKAVAKLRENALPERHETIAQVEHEIEERFSAAHGFVRRLRQKLAEGDPVHKRLARAAGIAPKVHALIDKATVHLDMPPVISAELSERMIEIEKFLGQNWTPENQRGVLAVHVDSATPATILQIGIAEHGPLYVYLPGVLSPEDLARDSIRALVERMEPFREMVDPMAVINGQHQAVNYNPLFKTARVIRAPSGDMARLTSNLELTRERRRMEPDNTTIINSAPNSLQEYTAVFDDDPTAASWPIWNGVAAQWSGAATHDGFAVRPEASREALITALATQENVIVVMAHCKGQQLFLPHPPPQGTNLTAEHLQQHRDEIRKNKPFVLLFACQAGRMSDVTSFAEVLLECGAAGVVAAQGNVGASALDYLTRLLSHTRGTPPIEDVWRAMRDTNFYEMEAFLG